MASFALEHLTFAYPGQTRPALDDLTLTVPEGAVTVLCGESGSGKSTLLRQLKTCLTPHGETGGTVRFVTENEQTIEHLKVLEQKGVKLIVCGTCLNFYGLTDKLQCGTIGNMYDIVETMTKAGKVIRVNQRELGRTVQQWERRMSNVTGGM